MAYIVTRNNRYYVVSYDGIDPSTGKERRRWQLAGTSRADAEAIAESLTQAPESAISLGRDAVTLSDYYRTAWLPKRARCVRATTAYRYGWIIDHYINPTLGDFALRSLRTQHIDDLYTSLLASGGRNGDGLAPKTSTKSTSSSDPRSTTPSTADSCATTPPPRPDRHDPTPVDEPEHQYGMPHNSPSSSTPPVTIVSI